MTLHMPILQGLPWYLSHSVQPDLLDDRICFTVLEEDAKNLIVFLTVAVKEVSLRCSSFDERGFRPRLSGN